MPLRPFLDLLCLFLFYFVFKSRGEWQTVTKSSGKEVKSLSNGGGGSNGKNKCYFRMSINGVMSERIIVQLEQVKAPIMCAKFIEMCTTKNGYKGLKIYKVLPSSRCSCLYSDSLKICLLGNQRRISVLQPWLVSYKLFG